MLRMEYLGQECQDLDGYTTCGCHSVWSNPRPSDACLTSVLEVALLAAVESVAVAMPMAQTAQEELELGINFSSMKIWPTFTKWQDPSAL